MTSLTPPAASSGFRWRLRASVAIARLAGRSLLFYRTSLAISVLVLLVQIYALSMVWTSVYADRGAVPGSGGVGDISIEMQLAYVSLSVVQFWVLNGWSAYSLQQRVREGRVGTDLARPLGSAVAGRDGTGRHDRRLPALRRRRLWSWPPPSATSPHRRVWVRRPATWLLCSWLRSSRSSSSCWWT